jgi:flagellar hook-associated protein 1
MSLGDALSIAMAGLRANQAAMSLVSSNVANAETPGYVRKSTDQVTTNTGSTGSGVNVNGINRELDQYVQAQLRTETSGASYASLRSDFLQQLQGIYGDPNASGTLESSFNSLTTAVQALGTSPDSASARIGVINAAQALAGQLNSMSQGIQTLRGAAETGISDSVGTANSLMKQIADINNQLRTNPLGGTSTDSATAALLDQRDQYVNQLSQLMDIRVSTNSANQVTISTGSGVQLVGNEASVLSFNAQGTVNPSTTYNPNTALSSLGSVRVSYADGGSVDLTDSIKSGKIAAYVDLRDNTLVQAQNHRDEIRQRHQPDLHRHGEQHPAHRLHRAGRLRVGAAAAELHDCRSERYRGRGRFLGSLRFGGVAAQRGAQHLQSVLLGHQPGGAGAQSAGSQQCRLLDG